MPKINLRTSIFLKILSSTILGMFFSCSNPPIHDNILETALRSNNPKIKRVMDSLDQFEVQIRYTKIDRKNDSVFFTDYDFQVDESNYFYPASTVKFPIAVLALEHLNKTDTLNREVRYYVEGDTLESTFSKDILQIFTVSDNLANNRLVELLGQDAINKSLVEKGIGPLRISHRLGYLSEDLETKPLIIYLNDSSTAMTVPTLNSPPKPLDLNKVKKGSGYYEDGNLIEEPFDFSLKNYYSIKAQHDVLKRVIFPEHFIPNQQFELSQEQKAFLLKAMKTLPRNAGYDPEEFYDGYCKFFIYGDTKETIPSTMEIYNKVGFAYGTLTDCAYIKDTKNKVDFMLTATILVNKDGIFNDDAYEYEEIGIPFLAELGREIYKLELQRTR
ncbi:class A beta-lactamase-related serine hydrolase [Maribacter litopenaei]|uniref:Class A beta-lactamase-related serine hydrolase n=1 Tax=Maribacter litopenaei TaxID=2976127 RepID=A0ABY5YCI9_9FLAO|nr:class A beta-lactamase-related serine hydrolase [Maribacter litopenaei]UWX55934.1 class A beta-lactamase-related serine hydrolase [Maribacter litopenaei]